MAPPACSLRWTVATGKIIGQHQRRHRQPGVPAVPQDIDKNTPADLDLHLICDNYATHKTPAIKQWLATQSSLPRRRRWRSRTGPRGCWPSISASGLRRLRGDVEEVGPAAVAGGDVQVLHRPRARGEDPRRRRALPGPARRTRSCCASTRSPRSRRWTAPSRSCRSGPALPERRTHDYKRHGTTTLFAALEVATGKVTDACYPRHRHEEFLASSSRSPRPTRGARCTSCWTTTPPTSTPTIRPGWRKNPRITLHFTPTSGSWLNMVEIFFGIITRQAIRRGTFTRSRTSSPPSEPSSTPGTTAASHSSSVLSG